MKRTFGLLGTIVLAVLIAFLITSCPELFPDPNNTENDDPGNDNKQPDSKKPDNEKPKDDKPDNGDNPQPDIVITDVNEIAAYLKEQEGGAEKDDPVELIVKFDLGTLNTNSSWEKLLGAIKTEGKYVDLDLSACGISAPFSDTLTAQTGQDKIISLTLPDKLENGIVNGSGSSAVFRNFSNLKSVTGRNLETIGQYAFADCVSLTSANFPNADNIGDYAFNNCTSLMSASIPKATKINPYAFAGCTSLVDVDFSKAQFIGDFAFSGSGLESADFPEVITIFPSAFFNCTSLTEVNFPEAKIIGDYAFSGSGLVSANFPEVTVVHAYAFSNCVNLTEVNFPKTHTIGSYAFSGSSLESAAFGSSLVFVSSAEFPNITIGQYAFADCTSLVEVDFPKAQIIGNYAFYGCTSLKIADYPNVTVINPNAFEGCVSLVEIDFSNTEIIGNFAFSGSGLVLAVFPEVTIIYPDAFKDCKSLTEVSFTKAVIIAHEVFKDCTSLKTASFLADPDRTTSGHPLQPWKDGSANGLFTSDCLVVHSYAFGGCTSLEELIIPNAWNVYFAEDVLANIGTDINIYLFENDDSTKSYGHPQLALFLGNGNTVSINSINLIVSPNGQKIKVQGESAQGSGIAAFIKTVYPGVTVTVNGVTFYN